MKKINIPTSFGHPTVKVSINSKDYQLETGKTIEVEDFIAECVENAFGEKPAKPAKPYYEDLRVIKEFDFANDADERGTINYEWFYFEANTTYVLEVNGTQIDIETEAEYGSGYGEYSGKLFGENLHITCTNATCKAPLKVKLCTKVFRPVLDKPYVKFFDNFTLDNQDTFVYADEEKTIKVDRDYLFEVIKAGKVIILERSGMEYFPSHEDNGNGFNLITSGSKYMII